MPAPASRAAITAVWLLGMAPIAFLPGLNDRWGWPVLLCVAGAALAAIWAPVAGRMPRGIVISAAIVVLALMITALAGAAPLAQMLGRAPRYEGLIEWTALFGAAWVAARVLGPGARPEARRHASAALVTAAMLLAAVALLEAIGLRPIESDLARPGSLAGNATDQGILGAAYVAILGMLAVGRWRRAERQSGWVIAGTVAGAIAVSTSASRAGLLALGVVVVALIVRALVGKAHRRRAVLTIAGGTLVLAAAVLIVPLTRSRVLGVSRFAQQTIEDRLIMWGDAWSLLLTTPWFGVGPNGFADAITTRFSDGWFDRAGVGAILDSPHNAIIQALVVGGLVSALPALVLGIAVVVATAQRSRRATGARRDALLGAAAAVLVAGLALLTHVTSPKTLVLVAALVGFLVAAAPKQARPGPSSGVRTERMRWPERRVWVSMAVGVWLIALVVMTIADARLLSGRAAIARGDLPEASAAFSDAASLRPWDPDIALVAAESFGGAVQNGLAGALDGARAYASRAVQTLPDSSRAQYVAGMVATLGGDVAAAHGYLARAAALSLVDPRIQHEYGVAAYFVGELHEARGALERAAELSPDASATWAVLAQVCRDLGDRACGDSAREHEVEFAPAPAQE